MERMKQPYYMLRAIHGIGFRDVCDSELIFTHGHFGHWCRVRIGYLMSTL